MTDKIRSCVSTCGKTRTPGQRVPAHSDRPLQGQPPRLTLRPPAHPQRANPARSREEPQHLTGVLSCVLMHATCILPSPPSSPLNPHLICTHTCPTTTTKGPRQPAAVLPEIPNRQDGEPPPKAHRWHPQGRSAMPLTF